MSLHSDAIIEQDVIWQAQVDLSAAHTLGLACIAERVADVRNLKGLAAVLDKAGSGDVQVLGEGSNVVLPPELAGVVIRWCGARVRLEARDSNRVQLWAEAGVRWDQFVRDCAGRGWWGIENLALIPGTVGAAPIQNIGAYGQELDDVCQAVCVWDRLTQQYLELPAAECAFGYRCSRFREEASRWIIVAVRLSLRLHGPPLLEYPGVAHELDAMGLSGAHPSDLVAAVSAVRQRKLPDPVTEPNAGSFFKNPVVSERAAAELLARFPDMPVRQGEAGCKLSAAWLIERAGWRGRRLGPVGMSSRHSLVLVRHEPADQHAVRALMQAVQGAVWQQFGLWLEPEPRFL